MTGVEAIDEEIEATSHNASMELLTEDFLLKMRRLLDFEWVWYCGSTLAVS